ncbi:hypothetical protein CEXT_540491 [Caerostris extrusa]|uniref:Uncharacterized protein n=1 Tax=Caerostris extrusa TaxID=172846 RepID=A0AAV4VXZ7_CAEEX|nr:hypothetical protein CEXT_540491 [Caerostris extrusa]
MSWEKTLTNQEEVISKLFHLLQQSPLNVSNLMAVTSTAIRNEMAVEVTATCKYREYILNIGLLVATFKIKLLLSLLVLTIWNPLRLKFASFQCFDLFFQVIEISKPIVLNAMSQYYSTISLYRFLHFLGRIRTNYCFNESL